MECVCDIGRAASLENLDVNTHTPCGSLDGSELQ